MIGTREEWLTARRELLAYRERMDWSFPWVSSPGSFNSDFAALGDFSLNGRELHDLSALADRTPNDRGDNLDGWPRRHDEYEEALSAG